MNDNTNTERKPMHIVRLEASNIKKLKAIEILPNGRVVTISGKNGAGKSSVLDSITFALGGKDKVCERPIRDGQSKAHVVCELSDLIVTRKFTAAGGSTLTVTTRDGSPVKSPQQVLDSLCASVAFDPWSFVTMDRHEQLETLKKLVGLDFTALDAKKKKAYEERTSVNREATVLKAKLAGYKLDPAAPKEEIRVADLLTKLTEIDAKASTEVGSIRRERSTYIDSAREINAKNDCVVGRLHNLERVNASLTEDMSRLGAEILDLQNELNKKREAYKAMKEEAEQAARDMAAVKAEVDTLPWMDLSKIDSKFAAQEEEVSKRTAELKAPIQQQIASADETNKRVATNARYHELRKELQAVESKADALTQEIEKCDSDKRDQLAAAKFPLPNISFDETGVLLDGVPFSQGSQAEQIRAAVAIGMALNPTIRVFLIRDASLMDEDSMKLMAELAEQYDAQVWEEVVNSNAPGSIVIEDGAVKD